MDSLLHPLRQAAIVLGAVALTLTAPAQQIPTPGVAPQNAPLTTINLVGPPTCADPDATCPAGSMQGGQSGSDFFGTTPAACPICLDAAKAGGTPGPPMCQTSQWTSVTINSTLPNPVPNPVRDLMVPKFDPEAVGADNCATLIQAELTFEYTLCGVLRVEHRDPLNFCAGAMVLSSQAFLDVPFCEIPDPTDPTMTIPDPIVTFPVPNLPPIQETVSFTGGMMNPDPLAPFDGIVDFQGDSGHTERFDPQTLTVCVRITDAATLQRLTDMTADGITDKVFFPHRSTDTSEFIGCAPITFKSDPFAGLSVSVEYIFCSNARPVCQDDQFRVCRDSQNNSFNVLANDTDPEGMLDCTSLTITTPPANGMATVVGCVGMGASCPGCRVEYTPNPGYTGPDSFTYSIADASGCPGAQDCTVNIDVCATDAVDDSFRTCRNQAVTFDVLANDASSCGALDPSSLTIGTPPTNGTAMINPDGTITYTPNMNYDGPDSFTYMVTSAGRRACPGQATVTLEVCRTFARPNLDNVVCRDGSIVIDVLGNDETTCGNLDPSSVMITIPPSNGTAMVNANGSITYMPNPGFIGNDGFQYSVASDEAPFCADSGNVSVMVCETNAVDDDRRTCVDAPIAIDVLTNDSTSCGALDPTSLMVTSGPSSGMATVNADGTITYTPNGGFFGSDSFTYQICNNLGTPCCDTATVTIEVCSVTAPDVQAAVCTGDSVMITLPGSSTCGSATCSLGMRPSNGMVSFNGCTATYTPAPGFVGTDTFTYRVVSGRRPFCEDTGTVTVTVCQTIAVDDNPPRICDGQPISIPVTNNDSTACGTLDCGSITIVTPPMGGMATPNGCSIDYVPNPGFSGMDSFTYSICNTGGDVVCCDTATVTLEVCSTTANDDMGRTCAGDQACFSVLANDSTTCGRLNPATLAIVSPPSAGTASVVGNQICYTPPANFSGTVMIGYQVGNTGSPSCVDGATLTVEVCDTVANDDGTFDVCAGDSISIPVTANDTTTCGNILCSTLTVTSPPSNGTAMVQGCMIVYTANAGFSGPDSFTYSVGNDQRPTCTDSATVTLNVCSTTANDDLGFRVCVGDSILIPVTANDSTTCPTLDCSTIAITSPPASGSVAVEGCSIRYTPGTTTGQVCFTYSIANSLGCTDTAMVCVDVCQVVAVDDGPLRVCAGDQLSIAVTANDSATCGNLDCSSITITSPPASGTAVPNGCNVVYTAPAGFSGLVTFTYQICDDQSPACCDTATVTVEVCETVAMDDGTFDVCAGDSISLDVTANDTTTCGNILCSSLTIVTPPAHGSAMVSGCSILYTADAGYSGPDSFTYSVGNGRRPICTDTATVTLNVCSTTANDDLGYRVCVGDTVLIPVTDNDSTSCPTLDCSTITITSPPASGSAAVEGCSIRYTPGTTTGQVCFTYSIANTTGCTDTATVCVDVCRVIARNDGRLRVCSGEQITIPVTNNDESACGNLDCGSITITSPPANGNAVPNGCDVIYTAPAGFSGTVTFEYQICDDQTPPCCDTATVTVEVCDVTAMDDTARTCAGDAVDIPVTANDSTTCGNLDCSSITITSPPATGSAVRNGCNVTYTPPAGFTGQVTFEYEICNNDTPTCCDRATVTVDVCETIALDDVAEVCPGDTVSIPVSSNDSTSCGVLDCTSITVITGPTNGIAVRNGCNVDYTPNPGFVGVDNFQYRICGGLDPTCCDVANVTVTVNPAPDAMDDEATLPPTGTDPIDIDVLDNDLPGAPCVLVPSSVMIVTPPARGIITNIDPLTGVVTYQPDATFIEGTDLFCYSVMNDCGCIDTACVTVIRPENPCPMVNRRMPSSLILWTEFDNRQANQTLISLTNTNCNQFNGDVYVHLFYVNEDNCLKSDFTVHLTPCDTWTAITSAHNPNFQRGYVFGFAINAQGRAISFNHLIANQIVLDGIGAFDYGLNAVGFKAVPRVDGEFTDLDGDGHPDLDGVEYEEAPDRILIPRFIGQDPPGGGPNRSELVLINLSGGQSFTTTVDLMIYNDNEEGFSAQKTFYCWDRFPLSEVSGSFLESFLKGTNHDPDEILGDPATEAGWFWVDGRVANSTIETIVDPAIYAVLIERSIPHTVGDLPWEECVQDNGDLCVIGPLGDGPNPVIGDNQ